jgi:phosphopantothenoylcysteine synthetase/decarboxylase
MTGMTDAPDASTSHRGVLYIVACGAPLARRLPELVHLAQQRGWTVCLTTTPMGRRFADVPSLERATCRPVRHDYKQPGDPDVFPPADAILVAPATSNTLAKWAAGISDTLALGLIVEGLGAGVPTASVVATNTALAAHPAVRRAVADLTSWGVAMVEAVHDRANPGDWVADFPWAAALDAVDAAVRRSL